MRTSISVWRAVPCDRVRVVVAAAGLTLWVSPAFAYIDPGSSLLLLQGALAALGGLVLVLRNPLKTMNSVIARLRAKKRA